MNSKPKDQIQYVNMVQHTILGLTVNHSTSFHPILKHKI